MKEVYYVKKNHFNNVNGSDVDIMLADDDPFGTCGASFRKRIYRRI